MTGALAEVHVIPKGMTVEEDHGPYPLEFFKVGNSYQTSACLRDSRGWARVIFSVTAEQPMTDVITCAAVKQYISCTEKTLPDGSKARVVTTPGPIGVPASAPKRLTVYRSKGSFMEVYVGTSGDPRASDLPPVPPSRDESPLSDEDLLRIAEILGLVY